MSRRYPRAVSSYPSGKLPRCDRLDARRGAHLSGGGCRARLAGRAAARRRPTSPGSRRPCRPAATARGGWSSRCASLSYEATAQSQEAVARAVAPLHETLRRYEQRVTELERDRVDAYAELREQVRSMGAVSGELRTETKQLVAALRAPAGPGPLGRASAAPHRRGGRPAGALRLRRAGHGRDRRPGRTPRPAWSGCTAAGPWWSTRRRRSTPTCRRWRRATSAPATPTSTSTPSTCAGTSTRCRPRRTGRRSTRRPTSWCCSCRPTRSWTRPCSATRR